MKKGFLAAGITLALFSIGLVVFFGISSTNSSHPPATPPIVPSPAPPPKPIADMAKPKLLHIGQLNVESTIEEVGLEPNGDMATPPNNTNVGWYTGGAIPGNTGRAVLAAHTGVPDAPTIFRTFEILKQGDSFQIEDVNGQVAEFEVIETATYTPENAPRSLIFGPSSTARVALITCTGTWIPQQKTYSHRLVIFAVRRA